MHQIPHDWLGHDKIGWQVLAWHTNLKRFI